jgi:hypothetical protein
MQIRLMAGTKGMAPAKILIASPSSFGEISAVKPGSQAATEEAAVQTFPSKTPDAAAGVKCGMSPVSRYLYGLSEVIQGRKQFNAL